MTKLLLVNPVTRKKTKKYEPHLPKGLRACMTCLKWVNGSDFMEKCQCSHPRYASSQSVGAAIVHMRQDFPKGRLKKMSIGERVDFMRAVANLFRPYAPSVADALDVYDGTEITGIFPPEDDDDSTMR